MSGHEKITVDNVLKALENFEPEVVMDDDTIERANAPLVQMLELAK